MENQIPLYQDRPILDYPHDDRRESSEVGIIKGLDTKDYLTEVFLRLNGWEYDIIKDVWILPAHPKPLMNELGIKNFMETLHSIAGKVTTMSNFEKEEINIRVEKFVKHNLKHFIAFDDEYNLHERDYNIIRNYLFNIADGSYRKAKGAGDRNTVRGVYSEAQMARSNIGMQMEEPMKKKGFFSFLGGGK